MSTVPVIVEHSANRHSRAVLKDGVIVIRLARNLPPAVAAAHEASLRRRMAALAAREQRRIAIDPFRPVLAGAALHTVCLLGSAVTICSEQGRRTRLHTDRDVWTLCLGPEADLRGVHRALWHAAARVCREAVTEEVLRLNRDTLCLPVRSVGLRYTRSQWGSCSGRGDISLATALLFLPAELRDYVTLHELAHLRWRGHGPRFWGLVERAMPGFRASVAALRRYQVVPL